MPSTYSPSLRLELIGAGEQSGTWGTTTNTNLGTLLEQSIAGVQAITMVNADYVLTNNNGVSDEARKAVIVAAGTNSAIRSIVAPLVTKTYTIKNNTAGGFAILIKANTGASVSIPNGGTSTVYCDGTDFQLANAQVTYVAGTGVSITTVGSVNTVGIDSTVATLTGTQTLTNKSSTTQALGDSSTAIATTAFVNRGSRLDTIGYEKLPSGLIMQWGQAVTTAGGGGGTVTVTYPISFPTATLSITGNANSSTVYNSAQVQFGAANTTSFIAYANGPTIQFYWFAIGY